MAVILKGIYRNGVIEPLTPVKIKEGTSVAIFIEDTQEFLEDLDVLISLHRDGFLNSLPALTAETLPEIQPVSVKGKPVSETIIEDRGAL
jgi:predicted DNA-binding antitoxin AbrB/MazE fold protein